ncbi:hypothetical protein KTR66_04755 [Roseococcus sp. SDR]|uniref:hypothetical protein n=1 Tax=Roseococcus sp. SDR TaxID=2835532 RepID=UPI001BCE6EF4|nr:hypothetical protein [Roseococcus sp. SDR]MBS7789290.1 hypothetical protein [Roseococcus sp. SDR]MBV1844604.1 hypothetical protein [Roseococcus sp. SDR]
MNVMQAFCHAAAQGWDRGRREEREEFELRVRLFGPWRASLRHDWPFWLLLISQSWKLGAALALALG